MRNELPGDLRNQHGSLRTTRRGISQHPGRDLKDSLLRACLRGVKSAIRFHIESFGAESFDASAEILNAHNWLRQNWPTDEVRHDRRFSG